jgi:predicted ATPase
LAVLSRIHDLIEDASQFIIATHFCACGPEGIRQVEYEETAHHEVTKGFLENPKRMLDILLSRPPDV